MTLKIEINKQHLLNPIETCLAQCKQMHWKITKNTPGNFNYNTMYVANQLQYGIIGKALEMKELLNDKAEVERKINLAIKKLNRIEEIIRFYANNCATADPRIIHLSKKINALSKSENQKTQEKVKKYLNTLSEFSLLCAPNAKTLALVQENREKLSALTSKNNEKTLILSPAKTYEKSLILSPTKIHLSQKAAEVEPLPSVLIKIINTLSLDGEEENYQTFQQDYKRSHLFPLSQATQTVGQRICFQIKCMQKTTSNPTQSQAITLKGEEDATLHLRAVQRVLVEVLLAELTNGIQHNQCTAVTEKFALLESITMAPEDSLPKYSNLAHALFKALYQFYTQAREFDSSLPHPESGVFKNDFGRIAFTGEHQVFIKKEFKIQVLENFSGSLKKAWNLEG